MKEVHADRGADGAELIRAARGRSNRAIAVHDLDAIAAEWSADIHVLGSVGLLASGIAANRQSLARQFERRPDTVYVRAPTNVEVFAPWQVASELGTWVGTWTEPDGPLQIGGSYQARWGLDSGRWLIRSELFVPTWCKGGAYCEQAPISVLR